MQFRITLKGLEETRKKLDPKIHEKAMRATVNDLAKTIETQVAKQIKQRYTLPSARIKAGIDVSPASEYRLKATVTFSGKTPGMQHYKAQQKLVNVTRTIHRKGFLITKSNKRQRVLARGVQVEIIRGQKKIVRGAFLAESNLGVGIWRRVGEKRIPLKRLYGPSIKGMFVQMGGKKIAEQIINERLLKTFYRNVERYSYMAGRH